MQRTLRSAWCLGLVLIGGGCHDSASGRIAVDDRADAGRAADGGGLGGGDEESDAGGTARLRLARFTSAPTTYALVGERYTYRPRSNGVALSSFSLAEKPAGMQIARGQIEWTPTVEQGGGAPHRVTVRGQDGTRTVEQTFQLTVATSVERARRAIASGTGGSLSVQSGELTGAAVNVARGGLAAGEDLTVSELSAAPALPNMVGRSRAVRFGPTGTVFGSPATITLPLPGTPTITEATLSAYVWNPEGRWQRVQVLAIDHDNHVMIARARHFSIYVAAQSQLALSARLSRAGAGTACADEVTAYAEVTSGLETATLSSVNNLPAALIPAGADPAVAPITSLLGPTFQGSLRVVHVFDLVEPHDGAELALDQRMLATTAYFPGDGTLTITHTDALGNVLGVAHYVDLTSALADVRARLSGAALAASFRVTPASSQAIAPHVHVAYYEDDATRDPIDADALGLAATGRGPVLLDQAEISDDADCDGLRDAFDESDDRSRARVELVPSAARTLMTGEALTLTAKLIDGAADATASWSVSGPDGATAEALTAGTEPDAQVFSATTPGSYVVSVRFESGTELLEKQFTLEVVTPPEQTSQLPTCVPSKPIETGRVGEPVALAAVLADPASPVSSLRARWGLVTGAGGALVDDAALRAHGTFALFSPSAAGAYTIGCQAYDGARWGTVGTIALPVVAAAANRAPEALTVTPAPTELAAGASLSLQAFARDPDGDALRYTWQTEGAVELLTDPADDDAGTRRHLRASTRAGTAKVTVTVSDGTATEWLELPLQVVSDVADAGTSTGTVDTDAGMDGGTRIDSGILDDAQTATDGG